MINKYAEMLRAIKYLVINKEFYFIYLHHFTLVLYMLLKKIVNSCNYSRLLYRHDLS